MQILAIRQAMRFNVLELAPKPLEIQVLLMLGLTQIKALQKVMKVVGRWVNEEVERQVIRLAAQQVKLMAIKWAVGVWARRSVMVIHCSVLKPMVFKLFPATKRLDSKWLQGVSQPPA